LEQRTNYEAPHYAVLKQKSHNFAVTDAAHVQLSFELGMIGTCTEYPMGYGLGAK
jgi:hypothetical protein